MSSCGTYIQSLWGFRRSYKLSLKSINRYTTAKVLALEDFVPRFAASPYTKNDINRLEEFLLASKRLFVLTGAGVSTESGIRDYRSEGIGLYSISDQRPISHSDFISKPNRRHRYWARNYAGWPIFSSKLPNVTHLCLADMEKSGKIHWLVTQNVDGLHQKAGHVKITELHGSASRVQCLSCKSEISRYELQDKLNSLNADWGLHQDYQDAPDGDLIVEDSFIQSFKMHNCENCNGILKPRIVFFGDNVPGNRKQFVNDKLSESDALLIIGSSTETFSSYRIVLAAKEQRKPIAILNIGKTRSDHLADFKMSAVSGDILPELKFY